MELICTLNIFCVCFSTIFARTVRIAFLYPLVQSGNQKLFSTLLCVSGVHKALITLYWCDYCKFSTFWLLGALKEHHIVMEKQNLLATSIQFGFIVIMGMIFLIQSFVCLRSYIEAKVKINSLLPLKYTTSGPVYCTLFIR